MKYLLAFTLLIFSLPQLAQASLLDIQRVESKGGVTAWLVEDHSVPVISIEFGFAGAGAVLDPADKQGLARMLSNTMDEGAGDLDSQAFQKLLQDLSITLAFSASRDDFTGSLKTLTRNKKRAFELLELALTEPRFDDAPVERMRAANQSRIRSSLSDPEWMAARIKNDVVFSGHPYAQNSGGTLSTLDNITPDDLRKLHKRIIARDNLRIAVAGDITADELRDALNDVFGGLHGKTLSDKPKTSPITVEGQTTLLKKDIPQTVIEVVQPGIDRAHPHYQAAQVMNFILGGSGFGSRLTKVIREERGLTYGIYSYMMDYDDFDSLEVSTSTKNESVGELLALIKAAWQRMKEEPVSEDELRSAVTYLTGSLPLSLTSTDKISRLLLSLQLDGLPIDYLDQRDAALKAVTIEDVQTVAVELLTPDQMSIVLVGQPEGIEADTTLETLPNVE